MNKSSAKQHFIRKKRNVPLQQAFEIYTFSFSFVHEHELLIGRKAEINQIILNKIIENDLNINIFKNKLLIGV
jgi:hypothetical protein